MKKIIKTICLILTVIVSVSCLASCSGKKANTLPGVLYPSFKINIESQYDEEYFIHFMTLDAKSRGQNAAAESGKFITFEAGKNREMTIDLNEEFDQLAELMTKSTDLKIVLTSIDDPFVRNIISEEYKIRLYVVEDENGNAVIRSPLEDITVKVSAKSSKSGISLAFPNASFIIKLDVSESGIEIEEDTKFDVFLYDVSDASGNTRIGRISKGLNYWEVPFYKEEIASKSFTLVIKEFSKDKEISYINSPMTFTFNSEGLSYSGSFITVKLDNQNQQH